MSRTIILAAALVLSGPAFAQQQTTQPGAAGAQGMQTLTTSTVTLTFANAQPTDVAASRLMGTDIYNQQDEDIGEIQDVLIADGKTVRAVVLSIGGFLGMGERYVAVEPGSITLMRSEDGRILRAVVDATKEQLNNAPTFDYSQFRSGQ